MMERRVEPVHPEEVPVDVHSVLGEERERGEECREWKGRPLLHRVKVELDTAKWLSVCGVRPVNIEP